MALLESGAGDKVGDKVEMCSYGLVWINIWLHS
jgi:hypothetical protein